MAELTKTVHVKVSEKQFEQLDEAAWSRRLSVSEWVRQCVFGKIAVRGAEPVTTKALDAKPVEGRTAGANPATAANPECKHTWIIRNGKTECQYCRSKP